MPISKKRWTITILVALALIALSCGSHYLALRNTVPFPYTESEYAYMQEKWFVDSWMRLYRQQTPLMAGLVVLTTCLAVILWNRSHPLPEKVQLGLMICVGGSVLAAPMLLFFNLYTLLVIAILMFGNAILILSRRFRSWKYAVVPLATNLVCMVWAYWYFLKWSAIFVPVEVENEPREGWVVPVGCARG